MPVSSWSTTASSNATADNASGINWAEGMSPAQVNDSARAMMAVIKGDLANNLSSTGYQRLPNGLVIQWGRAVDAAADYTVTFPVAFPSGCFVVTITPSTALPAGTGTFHAVAEGTSATAFGVHARAISPTGAVSAVPNLNIFWIAVGA